MESVEPAVAPPSPSAGRLLARRVREMFRVYPRALVGDVEAVHDLRVAARRLRVALALLAENPDGRRARRANRTLRDIARAAGQGRDFDVNLAILETSPSRPNEATERLRRALRRSRARARALSREALLDLDVGRLRRDLRTLIAATRVDREILAGRLAAMRLREEEIVGRGFAPLRAQPHPEALHSARRAARRLRYAAEISDVFEGTVSGVANRWRRMQAGLGEIQDLRVLAAWLESRARRAAATGDLALATAATRLHARVTRDASRRSRAFVAIEGPTIKPASTAQHREEPQDL